MVTAYFGLSGARGNSFPYQTCSSPGRLPRSTKYWPFVPEFKRHNRCMNACMYACVYAIVAATSEDQLVLVLYWPCAVCYFSYALLSHGSFQETAAPIWTST